MSSKVIFVDSDITVEIYDAVLAKWTLTDYAETDSTKLSYLRNRDLIQPRLVAGDSIVIDEVTNTISVDIHVNRFISEDANNELTLGSDNLLFVGFEKLLRNGGVLASKSDLPLSSEDFVMHYLSAEKTFVFAYNMLVDDTPVLSWQPLTFYVDMSLYVSKEELTPLLDEKVSTDLLSVAPTADSVALRDSSGRIQVTAGESDSDAVNVSQLANHNSSESAHPYIQGLITAIRNELNSREHFRRYFSTTSEVLAISDPREGDYAYNAETGTKWIYDVDSWSDSKVPVPDQTVPPSDSVPVMDGEGSAGVSTSYSRGDHVHPTDVSRASNEALQSEVNDRQAADTALQNGINSEASARGTADINLQNQIDNIKDGTTVVGAAEADGEGNNIPATYAKQDGSYPTLGAGKLALSEAVGSSVKPVYFSASGIPVACGGSLDVDITGSASNALQLDGHAANYFAVAGDLVSETAERVSADMALQSDIDGILEQLAHTQHFRGYYETTLEIQSLVTPQNGDYAWNAETGTVWNYVGSWVNSGEKIPDQTVPKSSTTPLMDGVAALGSTNTYADGGHRHPTDVSRAAAADLLNEANERQSADSNLQAGLSSEAEARKAADEGLQQQINNLPTPDLVVVNPVGEPTETLNSLQVGDTVYDLPIPTPTTANNGQVLGVVNGAYAFIDGGGVTTEANAAGGTTYTIETLRGNQ